MEISFLGMNCVRITGRDVAMVTDPPPKKSGLSEIKTNNDITLLTIPAEGVGGHPAAELPAKAGMVIDGPGEFEVKGTMVTGVSARLHTDAPEDGERGAFYSAVIDGIRVGYLGNVAPDLSNDQLEALGQVDVLVIPVGGHGLTLDSEAAAKIISQLEPRYVVPTHYDDGKTTYEVPQDKLEGFLKEVGSNPEPQPKLRIMAKDLPEETTVVVLQPHVS